MKNNSPCKSFVALVVLVLTSTHLLAEDLPGSKDPDGMKRFQGSTMVGYHEPQFEEYLLPLGRTKGIHPMKYAKSLPVEGMIGRYTYTAPMGTSPTELYRNYKEEFKRLGVVTLYEEGPGTGSLYVGLNKLAQEDGLGPLIQGSMLTGKERLLVGKSADPSPVYYHLYVGEKHPRTGSKRVADHQTFAQLIVITPKALDNKMVMTAEEMSKSLKDLGRVLLYGIYFDADQDTLRPDSKPTLESIAQLLKNQPTLKLRVVGHTDDQGAADHNLDLSKRRSQSVVRELAAQFGIAAERLDAFGCGLYAPVATNVTEEGRGKNRRVELLRWSTNG